MTDLAQRVIGAIEAEPSNLDMSRWSSAELDIESADCVAVHRKQAITCNTPCCIAGHIVALASQGEVEGARSAAEELEQEFDATEPIESMALALWQGAYGDSWLTALDNLFGRVELGPEAALAEFKIIAKKSRKAAKEGEENG